MFYYFKFGSPSFPSTLRNFTCRQPTYPHFISLLPYAQKHYTE